jgi:hypothetical protein
MLISRRADWKPMLSAAKPRIQDSSSSAFVLPQLSQTNLIMGRASGAIRCTSLRRCAPVPSPDQGSCECPEVNSWSRQRTLLREAGNSTLFYGAEFLIKAGRDFTERDHCKSPPVVIVNQRLARSLLSDENPIGKRIRPGIGNGYGPGLSPMREMVGVVADVKQAGLDAETSSGVGRQLPSGCPDLAQVPGTQKLGTLSQLVQKIVLPDFGLEFKCPGR